MKEKIVEWIEAVKHIKTNISDWDIESITLTKEELDTQLLPKNHMDQIPSVLVVNYYYCDVNGRSLLVYSLPMIDQNTYLLGLIIQNKLEHHTTVTLDSMEDNS